MDLFEHHSIQQSNLQAPLAFRMRPISLEQLVGQDHIVGFGQSLRLAIEADKIPSLILWGPPGSGKTTLAQLIGSHSASYFAPISALTSGLVTIRETINQARERFALYGIHTILFIDEIHRFNKIQQSILLPYVEDGTITLIGVTTENPSFEIIPPLLSRSRVFQVYQLSNEEIQLIIKRALDDQINGLGTLNVEIETQALESLTRRSNGDARNALNTLEMAVNTVVPNGHGIRFVSVLEMEKAIQYTPLIYDKSGEHHFNTISAYIKSVRGSDPDGAVYWLSQMLESGESPEFIIRRMIVLASEDIGLADPMALLTTVATQQAVHAIGLPEASIIMAQTTIYLATAPKSRTVYEALQKATNDVKLYGSQPIPMHLRNTHTTPTNTTSKEHGEVSQNTDWLFKSGYLPERFGGGRYYVPSEQGYEKLLSDKEKNIDDSGEGTE